MTIDWRILAALTLIITVAFAGLLISRANLRADLAMAKSESAALHLENTAMKEKLETQNRAVAALREAAEIRARKAKTAAATAHKSAQSYRDKAAHLMAQKGESCTDAEKLVESYRRAAK